MRQDGELLKCDRCGKIDFIAKDDKRKPEGWNGYKWAPPGWESGYAGDLCPECAAAYKSLVQEFMRSGMIKKAGE